MNKFQAFGLILLGFVLVHWLTAGHDEIIQGPLPDPSGISTAQFQSNK